MSGLAAEAQPTAQPVAQPTSRRRLRGRLLAWSAPVIVIVVVTATYLITTTVIAVMGVRSFDGDSYGQAEDKFSLLTNVNLVEEWKAYYDVGTARYAAGEAFPASLALERALELVPTESEGRGYAECLVAVNLSLAYEALGDGYVETGDVAMAASYYQNAVTANDGCTPQDTDPDDDTDRQLREESSTAQTRQQAKLDSLEDPPPVPSPSPSPDPSPSPSSSPPPEPSPEPSPSPSEEEQPKLDELRDRNKDANGTVGGEEEGEGGSGGTQSW